MQIDVLLDAHATIGESPLWSPTEDALYWMDIKGRTLHRVALGTGADRSWSVPADIGAFALTPALDGAVVALRTGVHLLDFASGRLNRLAPPPYDPSLHRFNEGACDATGRFWVGVMFDPLDPAAKEMQLSASLHSFTLDGGLRAEPDAAELHNGMAWSADGKTFFLSHSQKHCIFAFDFDPAGHLGHRRIFARTPEELGVPDGAAVDAEGGYWCALHGGWKLRRFAHDGSWDRDIDLPVSQPTMCTFGGARLDVMFVTSAAEKLNKTQLEREPHAGAVLRLVPGVEGVGRRVSVR